MKDIKSLIKRIDAVATNTVHAKIEALEKINRLAPRIQDIVKLVNHAGKNGIAVETLCRPKADMPGNSFAVRDSYLIYRNGDCTNTLTDDECYYLDYNGEVFTSTYAGKQDGFIFRFDSTFKIRAGFNGKEEKNKKELDRLERIIAEFEKFEEHVYNYIENEVIKKEEPKTDNNGSKLCEVVEVCPHCDHENIYKVPLEEVGEPIRVCHKCGRKIFICSECDDCANYGVCDWNENPDGSCGCHRGRIEAEEKDEKETAGDERLKQILDDCLEWMMYDNDDIVGTLEAIHFDNPDELRALGYETLATSVEEASQN